MNVYQVKFFKENIDTPFTMDAVITSLVLCKTCDKQLKNPQSPFHLKRNLRDHELEVPYASPCLTTLTPLERRLISLIQPFARVYTSWDREGVQGGVTYVPIEMSRFQKNIYLAAAERKIIQLGNIFRHPSAAAPFYTRNVNPASISRALTYLVGIHPSYSCLETPIAPPNPPSTSSGSGEPTNQDLRGCQTIDELELMFTVKRQNQRVRHGCDTDDSYIMDVRETEMDSDFMINWKANQPMRVFSGDAIPVESLAFPYIFCEGKKGETHQ